jgi:hypothetical protein
MKKGKVSLVVFLFVALCSFIIQPLEVSADTGNGKYMEAAAWTGTISWNSGIAATDGWQGDATSLSWAIESYSDSLLKYTYTWKTAEKDLSHIILQVTELPANTNYYWADANRTIPLTPYTFTSGGSNPLMPGDIYGLKFEFNNLLEVTWTFYSTQEPMWGNFYAKDGVDNSGEWATAYNTGLTTKDTDGYGWFAAVPDTKTYAPPVPVPPTVWLLGAGLVGLWGVRRRFSKK